MCGHIGFASTEGNRDYQNRRDVLLEGLALDSFRGWDSTGLAVVQSGNEKLPPFVYKKMLNGFDFIQLRSTQLLATSIDRTVVAIGHNRAATRGSVSDTNAHPFQYGHITLAHNGHISNTWDFVSQTDLAAVGVDVDSAKVAWAMSQKGEKEILEKVEGAYVFVWYNSQDQTLNIARNDRRTFYWAYIEKQNTMVWSSEDTLLNHLLLRREMEIDGEILYPKIHTWYKFSLKDLRAYEKIPFVPSQGRRGNTSSGTHRGFQNTQDAITEWERLHADSETEQKSLGTTRTNTPPSDNQEIEEIRRSLSSQRLKDFKRAGIPTTTKKVARAERELGKLGIKFEAPRMMIPEAFIKYRNQQKMGVILGRLTKEGHMVQIHQMTESTYHKYRNYGRIYIRCVNLRQINKNLFTVIGILHAQQEEFYKKWCLRNSPSELDESIPFEDANKILRTFKGPRGQLISEARFTELTESGCGHCDGFVNPTYHEKVMWVGDPPSPICHICTADATVLDKLGITVEKRLMN